MMIMRNKHFELARTVSGDTLTFKRGDKHVTIPMEPGELDLLFRFLGPLCETESMWRGGDATPNK